MESYYKDFVTTEQFNEIKKILNSQFSLVENKSDNSLIDESWKIVVSDGQIILSHHKNKFLNIEGDDNHPKLKQIYQTIDQYLAKDNQPLKISDPSHENKISSKFTSSMKETLMSSLAIFEDMKSKLLASITEVGQKHNLENGLYYLVLIDISHSTITAGNMTQPEYDKWIDGFIEIIENALKLSNNNTGVYFTSAGDGSLFLFRKFDDILDWKIKVEKLCAEHNKKSIEIKKPEHYQYHHKIIVHMGEVYFKDGGKDTNSFAVNITFKIEKQFLRNEFGITEAVKQSILPEINSGRLKIDEKNDFVLDDLITIPLWKLTVPEN